MLRPSISLIASITLFFFSSCGNKTGRKPNIEKTAKKELIGNKADSIPSEIKKEKTEEAEFVLTEENAIDFFFKYAKEVKENKVRLTTNMGSFTIQLFDNVPYHKANFIYLIKKGYFDNTQFHRIVKDFIIQGGNSDDKATGRKRAKIGRYLLPPDTRKGHKHHRGTISMPSSERDNPHKLASPYEFFIVVTKPGSYHLDGSYTPFGRIIEGMDIVDKINQVDVDEGDWPMLNVTILKAEVF
ncbi:peptidylprolyl isomerase [Croceitalea rosinachiae]|uniref:Peptidyl-prolyl cis-trans isomerase n=1 Tax=Croceitalea rosinachiae TaxID=3075596 RepID=A0ABU3AEC8_9FLAO|nr:peptidylprolyl isomerase [Croceitalea sp. F388]MDT0608547.1 peptidylprolyl isomerase [Croceitalea sp. F388]